MEIKYIGIGEVRLPNKYNLPTLHTLIYTDSGDVYPYNAVCLEFNIETFGDSVEEAIDRLKKMIVDYVKQTIETLPPGTLEQIIVNNSTFYLWEKYRQLSISIKQKDEPTSNYSLLEVA